MTRTRHPPHERGSLTSIQARASLSSMLQVLAYRDNSLSASSGVGASAGAARCCCPGRLAIVWSGSRCRS